MDTIETDRLVESVGLRRRRTQSELREVGAGVLNYPPDKPPPDSRPSEIWMDVQVAKTSNGWIVNISVVVQAADTHKATVDTRNEEELSG